MSCEQTRDWAIKNAISQGKDVKEASPFIIQCDLDSEERFAYFLERLAVAKAFLKYKRVETWCSKTAGHHHVQIILPNEMSYEARIAWAAILGSDPKREMLGISRKLKQEQMLFKPLNVPITML